MRSTADVQQALHESDNWNPSQAFGERLQQDQYWGLVYRSVRSSVGECVAAFRPLAISIPCQDPHLMYHWDGTEISAVFEKMRLL